MISVLYEDDDLIIIDKPAGILVHPTQANEDNTLVDFLKQKCPKIIKYNWPDKSRMGVVHRLDKDTSGIIVMAKNLEVLTKLQTQFKQRAVKKTYLALVYGKIEKDDGQIKAAITRGDDGAQKIQETSYSFSKNLIRGAQTNYHVLHRYLIDGRELTYVEVMPKTGRMHQIRVHFKFINHPIVGDPLYNTKESRQLSNELGIERQFLHASRIEFLHPKSAKKIIINSKLAFELNKIFDKLVAK